MFLSSVTTRRVDLRSLADDDLMALVAEGEPRAFEVIFDRHSAAAFSLAYRMCGRRAMAEDVVQEAFVSLWRSGARYDRARGSVRAWTLGIVRNRAIDMLRKESGRSPKLAVGGDELLERHAADELTDTEAVRRETAQEVRGAIEELPEDQSRVIRLAYFGGFSHSEIAEMLNEPLGTVKGRMRLGMDKIRATLAEAW